MTIEMDKFGGFYFDKDAAVHRPKTYTLIVEFPDATEEVDVAAADRETARKIGLLVLAGNDYQPGGKIADIIVRRRGELFM